MRYITIILILSIVLISACSNKIPVNPDLEISNDDCGKQGGHIVSIQGDKTACNSNEIDLGRVNDVKCMCECCKPSNKNDKQVDVLSLCNHTISGDCKAIRITSCNYNNSIIYSIDYGCTDVGSTYVDSSLNSLPFNCGGMPLPVPDEAREKECNELNKDCNESIKCPQ